MVHAMATSRRVSSDDNRRTGTRLQYLMRAARRVLVETTAHLALRSSVQVRRGGIASVLVLSMSATGAYQVATLLRLLRWLLTLRRSALLDKRRKRRLAMRV